MILWNAIFTTSAIVGMAALSNSMHATSHPSRTQAYDLVTKALHWRDVALQDSTSAWKLTHSAYAIAFLQSARMVADDATLEQLTRTDIARLSKTLDEMAAEARAKLAQSAPN